MKKKMWKKKEKLKRGKKKKKKMKRRKFVSKIEGLRSFATNVGMEMSFRSTAQKGSLADEAA